MHVCYTFGTFLEAPTSCLIVGAAFVFLACLKFHILMLEIESRFSYFPLFFPKSQKSHHANSDGYHTLKARFIFFNHLNKSLLFTSGCRMSEVIDHIVYKSRGAKRRTSFKKFTQIITESKNTLNHS
jgi:hypothetical protein